MQAGTYIAALVLMQADGCGPEDVEVVWEGYVPHEADHEARIIQARQLGDGILWAVARQDPYPVVAVKVVPYDPPGEARELFEEFCRLLDVAPLQSTWRRVVHGDRKTYLDQSTGTWMLYGSWGCRPTTIKAPDRTEALRLAVAELKREMGCDGR